MVFLTKIRQHENANHYLSLLLFFFIGLIFQACTVVGMLIGKSIDKKKGVGGQEVPIGELVRLEKATS
jgi:hypothetical protein